MQHLARVARLFLNFNFVLFVLGKYSLCSCGDEKAKWNIYNGMFSLVCGWFVNSEYTLCICGVKCCPLTHSLYMCTRVMCLLIAHGYRRGATLDR